MVEITGTFATPNASKFLQQLCKHFAHKIEVEFGPNEGTCSFSFGTAVMTADEAQLRVRFDLNDAAAAPTAKSVIDKHLERFAFREGFKAMEWVG